MVDTWTSRCGAETSRCGAETGRWEVRDGAAGGGERGEGEEVREMRKKGAKNAEFIGGFWGQNTFFYKKKSCTLAYVKNYV